MDVRHKAVCAACAVGFWRHLLEVCDELCLLAAACVSSSCYPSCACLCAVLWYPVGGVGVHATGCMPSAL